MIGDLGQCGCSRTEWIGLHVDRLLWAKCQCGRQAAGDQQAYVAAYQADVAAWREREEKLLGLLREARLSVEIAAEQAKERADRGTRGAPLTRRKLIDLLARIAAEVTP